MTDEREPGTTPEPGQEPDPATEAFDADAWFRSQFGGEPAVPPVAPPPAAPPTAPPAFAVPPVASAPPPSSAPVPLPPPPALVEPELRDNPMLEGAFAGPAPTEPAHVVEPEPTQPAEVVPTVAFAPEQLTGGAPVGDAATELLREPEAGGALDELFGEQSFQEYDDTLIPAVPRSEQRAGRAAGGDAAENGGEGGEPAPRAPLTRTQIVLLWVAGGLVAVLALVAIFVLGTRIPALIGPAPGAEPIATARPTPSASAPARPSGPVEPGEYRWDELGGGECLEPFVDAWQDVYTVVDCADPHGGQLVLRAPMPLAEGELTAGPYPGEQLLAVQTLQLCSSPGVLDLSVAGVLSDIVLQATFPVSEEAWDDGERDYFCFVSRSSGEPLTASLVGPGPAPSVLPTAPPAG